MRILSIDGGGIRGLIPALVLAEVEERTGRPIHALFDLIAGTSTGAILAAGLTVPDAADPTRPRLSAAALAELYDRDGPRIFARSLVRRVTSAEGLLDERYDVDGLREALERRVGASARLSGLLPGVEVLLTAYDLRRRRPMLLRSARARVDLGEDFPLVDAVLASAAAPSFFEPVELVDRAGRATYPLIDGGVYATNPALVALVDRLRDDEGARSGGAGPPPERPVDLAAVDVELLVSLGTGTHQEPFDVDDARGWGQLGWARRIVDVVFDGIADTTDYQLDRLLGRRHVRLQTPLVEGRDALDDASPANLRGLRADAEGLIARDSERIDALAERLLEGAPPPADPPPAV